MKHVFTTSQEIADEFICGTFDGHEKRNKSNNARTDGREFISYYTAIAKKYGRFVALDSYRYSNTTDKQKREIRAAAHSAGLVLVEIPNIHKPGSAENVEYLQRLLDMGADKARRARAAWRVDYWNRLRADALGTYLNLRELCAAAGQNINGITL